MRIMVVTIYLIIVVPEEGSKMLIEGCTFRDGYSNFGGGIDDGKLKPKFRKKDLMSFVFSIN